eukprot:TRINITY_DN4474_c1_g3_i1.p1 TRINITY_DN4474_c1_g3~~TRINITY_DN4474_c1_g3_i1.p1  ORF type:complete len:444 (-),score=203.48 TRINITY_DN4474_c1_g3_i1:118-1260(-)
MQQIAKKLGLKFRPHVKTHKCIQIAKLQTNEQIDNQKAIVVSTMAEVLFFHTKANFNDIIYGIPLALNRISQVANLIQTTLPTLQIIVDHITTLKAIENYCEQNQLNIKFNIWVKVDCGYGRAGIPTNLSNNSNNTNIDSNNTSIDSNNTDIDSNNTDKSIELIKNVFYSKFCNLEGLYTHSGHSYSVTNSIEAKQIAINEAQIVHTFAQKINQLSNNSIIISQIACGSTPACSALEQIENLSCTEIHPGNYVFFDAQQFHLGSCQFSQIAVFVIATILSHYPERNAILVNAGALALSKDSAGLDSWGIIIGHENLKFARISQEHGIITSSGTIDFNSLPIGSNLKIIPNHSCLSAACFKKYYVVQNDKIVDIWRPISQW